MQHGAGGTLVDVVKAAPGGYLKDAVARKYVAGILRGLEYMHDCRFIHRDVKER